MSSSCDLTLFSSVLSASMRGSSNTGDTNSRSAAGSTADVAASSTYSFSISPRPRAAFSSRSTSASWSVRNEPPVSGGESRWCSSARTDAAAAAAAADG